MLGAARKRDSLVGDLPGGGRAVGGLSDATNAPSPGGGRVFVHHGADKKAMESFPLKEASKRTKSDS